MPYRSLPDLKPLAEADLDNPEMVETATALALGEQHLRMLTRITEVGMELIEVISQNAKTDPASARADTDAFCKISQAVRRTVALQDKMARDVKSDREGLQVRRANRRKAVAEIFKETVDEAITGGLGDALDASFPDADSDDVERLLQGAQESLDDPDEFDGYLDRPVGETVGKLCAAVGLDPDSCLFDGQTWKVRRPPSQFETTRDTFRRKATGPDIDPMSIPPPCHTARGPP